LPVVKVRDFSVCMKKIITISCFSLSVIALLSVLGSQSACEKQSTNCPCVVTVTDTNNNPVSSAYVLLFAPHGQVENSGVTNTSGVIDFNFGLPAIFTVEASKVVATGDTLKGSNIIQLEIGQSVSVTVQIK
jgi:hypothetical protein